MFVLGVACGGIAALPFAHRARRETVASRARRLARSVPPAPRRSEVRRAHAMRARVLALVAPVRTVIGAPLRHRQQRRVESTLRRELPVVVDLAGVAVGAGCTPYLAVEHAARYGPDAAVPALRGVIHACALGASLDDALRDLGVAVPVFRPLADALRTSAELGSPAAPALARVAADVRADTRRRAEARARTVPVRLCFPLVACILPAFALLTVAPVVLGGLHP